MDIYKANVNFNSLLYNMQNTMEFLKHHSSFQLEVREANSNLRVRDPYRRKEQEEILYYYCETGCGVSNAEL